MHHGLRYDNRGHASIYCRDDYVYICRWCDIEYASLKIYGLDPEEFS
jgi:hypothetical protein